MTDPDLVHRAEQALLGALITSPGRLGDAGNLRAVDFTDRRHQAIFAAIAGSAEPGRAWPGRLRDWLTRLLSRRARDTAAYMEQLPGLCPEPAHLASYAAMLLQAREQREAAARAAQADVLASADTQLAGLAQNTRGRTPAPGNGTSLPTDVTRLAKALAVTARRLARDHQDAAAPGAAPAGHARQLGPAVLPPAPQSVLAASPSQSSPQAAEMSRAGEQAAVPERMRPRHLEQLLLADLLRRPGDARDVVAWLPAEAFTESPHRGLYQLISHVIRAGEPADPLIIAWHAAQQDVGPSPEFVLRAAAADPMPGTAAAIGRVLLADYVCTTRFGPDWTKSPQLTQPAAAKAPASEGGDAHLPAPGQATPTARPPGRQPQSAAPRLSRGPIPGSLDQGRAPGKAPATMAHPPPVPQQDDGPVPHT